MSFFLVLNTVLGVVYEESPLRSVTFPRIIFDQSAIPPLILLNGKLSIDATLN